MLPSNVAHKVKKQYVQILLLYTSIKRQIFGQSTSMLKGYMLIMFGIVDTAISYVRWLIVCLLLEELSKPKESTHCVI